MSTLTLRYLALILTLAGPLLAQDADPLANLRQAHPRLVVLDGDLDRIRSLIHRDEGARRIYERLLEKARAMESVPPVKYELVQGRMLAQSRQCVDRMYTLGLLYRLDGNPRYLARALAELRAAAGFPSWNDNFLDKAEMTHGVAIGYDWFYNSLSPEDRAVIRSSLVEKGLRDALPFYAEQRTWTANRFNWNPVCNGGIGLGALAVADQEPGLARTVLRYALHSLPLALTSYSPDGGWAEGPEYWHYATRYVVYFLAGLESALGHDFGLSASDGFSKTGLFRIYCSGPSQKWFNFADASDPMEGAPEMFWLARKFRQPVYAWHQHRQIELLKSSDAFDLIWYQPKGPAPQQARLPLHAYFRGGEVAMLRSSWDDRAAIFAGIKGGQNRDGRGHAHLDLGSFVLDAGGLRWALDLGKEDYSVPDYFGKLRFTYYRTKTESHNTVLIDNQDQDRLAESPIVAHRFQPDLAFVRVDLSKAYPDKLRHFERGVCLYQRKHVIVQDEIAAHVPVEALWGMVTDAEVSALGQEAKLRKGDWVLRAIILAPAGAQFDTVATQVPPPQTPSRNTRKLVVRLPDKISDLRLVVAFTPHPARQAPPRINWKDRSLKEW